VHWTVKVVTFAVKYLLSKKSHNAL